MIAPYRAQINYLKDAIEDSAVLNDLLLQRRLSVGTVDSFQGQERDIIAITLTRSNPQGEIGFLSDIRRMNVGMTRARRKLLLVGDSSTLCCHPFFVDLLAHVKRIGGYFQHAGSCDSFLNVIPIVPEAQQEYPYSALAKKTIDK